MGLWDDFTDAATTAWQAGRLQVAITEDVFDEHFLGNAQPDHAYRYASDAGIIPPEATPEDVRAASREYVANTPGLSEVADTADAIRDALPPGPWWMWTLIGVAVLGAGAAVAWRVLR